MTVTRTAADRRIGWRMLLALRIVTIGMFAALAVWGCIAVLVDLPALPTWPWEVAVLVAPVALVVYWRPERRWPDPESSLFLTGVSGFLLGLAGAGWGSWLAPAIGGATVLATFLAPKAGGRRGQRQRAGTRRAR